MKDDLIDLLRRYIDMSDKYEQIITDIKIYDHECDSHKDKNACDYSNQLKKQLEEQNNILFKIVEKLEGLDASDLKVI